MITGLLPGAEAAAEAQLFVHPTLVMLSEGKRSERLHIVNQGDATGVFELAWVDYAMTREGGLSVVDEIAAPSWSLQPFVRYSPRRVTLRPGETQIVKIALRAGGDVAEAEYYSHLRVVTLQDDVDAAAKGDPAPTGSVTVEARTAIAVPVIWRNSQAESRAAIESAVFEAARQRLIVELRRVGPLSTRGYLHVLGPDSRPLADPMPLVIYPSIERRTASVQLHQDAAPDAVAGARILYTPERELAGGGAPYATFRMTP